MNTEICRILMNICKMQKEAVREEIREEMCDGTLGSCARMAGPKFNTRPIEIYTHEDRAWECPVDRETPCCKVEGEARTCIFRVERVVGDTVTLRALRHHPHGCKDGHKYEQTDSFITIKLVDIAAIRCLRDCFVNLCIR